MGEFLTNAQGEDVVAGVRTPMPIAQMAEKFPRGIYDQFVKVCNPLENHYRDMQDMEFTIETASSTCSRPVTASAPLRPLLKIACDLVDEGMIE